MGEDAVLEVKCLYSFRDLSLKKFIEDSPIGVVRGFVVVDGKKKTRSIDGLLKCHDGDIKLKPTHAYYHQIQCELAMTDRETGYLIYWCNVDHVILTVPKDNSWITNIGKLITFYWKHYIPKMYEDIENY